MNSAAYIRRSTADQAESLTIQREIIENYASNNGFTIVEWYVDDGLSGGIEKRPAFQKMIADAGSGTFRSILCRNQSRFSRMGPLRTSEYMSRIDRHGVNLVTVEDGAIDPHDVGSWIKCQVNEFGNKKYLTDLSSNTIRGQARQVQSGSIAGQRAPYGYDRMYVDENGEHRQRVKVGEGYARAKSWRTILVPSDDPEIVARVRWIFDTYLNTSSGIRGIAHQLNELDVPSPKGGKWNQGTISAILRNRAYVGEYVWNRRRYGKHHQYTNGNATPRPNTEVNGDKVDVVRNEETDWVVSETLHEAIVDRTMFDAVQRRLVERATSANTRGQRRKRQPYLLSGLLYCRHCGGKMHGASHSKQKNGKKYRWRKYVCSTYHAYGKSHCTHNQVDADEIERTVVSQIVQKLDSPQNRQRLEQSVRRELQRRCVVTPRPIGSAKLAELDGMIDTLTDRVATVPDSVLPEVLAKLEKTKSQRDAVARELASHEDWEPASNIDALVLDAMGQLDTLAEKIQSADRHAAQDAVRAAVASVVLEFEPRAQGKRTVYRCVAGLICLTEKQVAGTGFEPVTSRL